LGLDPRWGAAGLTASAGIAGWIEFLLLRRALSRRIGEAGLPAGWVARLWAAAAAGAGAAWGLRLAVPVHRPVLSAIVLLALYGAVYFFITDRLRIPEAGAVIRRLWPREPEGAPKG